MAAKKRERRIYFRRLLAAFHAENFQNWNSQLTANLLKSTESLKPGSYIGVYRARPTEADLEPLFSLPFRFCFPKVLSKKGDMEFRWVAGDEREFEVGAYGILEPKAHHPRVESSELAAFFVPMLSFDESGCRLGWGKGYYDKILMGMKGLKIGVAYEWQFSPDFLPLEPHDQRLDLAVTECEIRRFSPAAPKT